MADQSADPAASGTTSLGQLYAQERANARPFSAGSDSPGSLGSLYAEWIGEDSGYIPVPDPAVVQTRRAQREGAGGAPATTAVPTAAGTQALPGGPEAGAVDPAVEAPTPAKGGIGRASFVMASGTLVSRALGFIRTILLGALIAQATGGAWITANNLPNQIYILLAGGVINAVLVPQITRALKHPDGGKSYTDRIITLGGSILLAATVILTLASPVVFRIGYLSASGDTLRLGILFTLICMPQLFFYGLYTLLGEVLNARSRFGALMWSPVLANLFAIAGIAWLLIAEGRHINDPSDWTTGMAIILAGSATLGIVAQALVLVIPLKRSGYVWRPNFGFRGIGLRGTSKIAAWAFASVILQQIGSMLVTGNILNHFAQFSANQAQSFALLFFMLPHSLVTLSLVTAVFTRMSRAAHEKRSGAVVEDTTLSLRLSSVATIAATFGAVVAAGPLAHLFYGDALGTAVERQTIGLLLGLVPFTVCVVVQRVFFAYEDARTPFFMQLICTVVSCVLAALALFLPGAWVGFGVCIATAVAWAVEAVIGFRWLQRRRLARLRIVDVMQTWVRLVIAAVLAVAVGFVLRVLVVLAVGDASRLASLVTLVVATGGFVAAYLVVARRLHVREVEDLIQLVGSKLGGVRRLVAR